MKTKRKTRAQRQAAVFLENYGIVHYLMTQQRVPVMFEGKLAFVRCPGVSKESFKKAIEELVVRNICEMIKAPIAKLTHEK